MSARDDLHAELEQWMHSHTADALLDAYAHELAEQIRNAPGWCDGEWMDSRDRDHAAALIDPEADR